MGISTPNGRKTYDDIRANGGYEMVCGTYKILKRGIDVRVVAARPEHPAPALSRTVRNFTRTRTVRVFFKN